MREKTFQEVKREKGGRFNEDKIREEKKTKRKEGREFRRNI